MACNGQTSLLELFLYELPSPQLLLLMDRSNSALRNFDISKTFKLWRDGFGQLAGLRWFDEVGEEIACCLRGLNSGVWNADASQL